MRRIMSVLQNRRGMTLIEVLVSMIILTVMLLGLARTVLLTIGQNMQNVIRSEALTIADERLNGVVVDSTGTAHNGLRNIPYANLAAEAGNFNVNRSFRNVTSVTYNVATAITDISDTATGTITASTVSVTITWTYRGTNYSHVVSTIIKL